MSNSTDNTKYYELYRAIDNITSQLASISRRLTEVEITLAKNQCKDGTEHQVNEIDAEFVNELLANSAYECHKNRLLDAATADKSFDILEWRLEEDVENSTEDRDDDDSNDRDDDDDSNDNPATFVTPQPSHLSILENHPLFRSVSNNLDRMSKGQSCYDVEDIKERRRNRSDNKQDTEDSEKYDYNFIDGLKDDASGYQSRHF